MNQRRGDAKKVPEEMIFTLKILTCNLNKETNEEGKILYCGLIGNS